MSNIVGKTITSLEENAPSPHNGAPDESIILIRFADGTALEVKGAGDDGDDWISHELLSAQQLTDRARLAQKHKDDATEQARKRAAWMALTCEQRAQQRPKKSSDALDIQGMAEMILEDIARSAGRTQIQLPCRKCGESQCPNASRRQLQPAQSIRSVLGAIDRAEQHGKPAAA